MDHCLIPLDEGRPVGRFQRLDAGGQPPLLRRDSGSPPLNLDLPPGDFLRLIELFEQRLGLVKFGLGAAPLQLLGVDLLL